MNQDYVEYRLDASLPYIGFVDEAAVLTILFFQGGEMALSLAGKSAIVTGSGSGNNL